LFWFPIQHTDRAQHAYLRSLLYLLHLHCDNRQKSPTPRFAHRGSPRRLSTPSRLAAFPPSRVKPRHVCRCVVLRLVALCPIPAPVRRASYLTRSKCYRRRHSPSGGRGRRRRWHRRYARPQLATLQDPEWPYPKRASLTAPSAPFLRCWKRMFQVFQMLQRHVASVSYVCCKSKSGCCICHNGCTCMLQTYVSNVSYIFSDACCICFTHIFQVFYLDIVYVLQWFLNVFRCFCKCFRRMFQVLHMPSDVCFKCCI
jgi:hypothetical protein